MIRNSTFCFSLKVLIFSSCFISNSALSESFSQSIKDNCDTNISIEKCSSFINDLTQQTLTKFAGNDTSAFLGFTPAVKLIKTPAPLGYSIPSKTKRPTIIISTGLLGQMTSFGQFAYVLGHEIGHLALDHGISSLISKENKMTEMSADVYAINFIRDIGEDEKSATIVLQSISDFFTINSNGKFIPSSLKDRINYLENYRNH